MCIIVSVFTFTGKIHIGIRCLRRNLFSTFMRASVNFLVEKKNGGASPCHGPVYVFRFGYSSSYQCYFFKGNNRIHYTYKHV